MKFALLGAWHVHAEGYGKDLKQIEGCELALVWDHDKARGSAMAQALDTAFEPKLDKVLDDQEIKGVLLCTETTLHDELLIKLAKAGKAIFTEKVLCAKTKDAEKAAEAIDKSGKPFAISFPHLCRPELIEAKRLVEAGELGDITYVRVRNVHAGSIAGWLPDSFYKVEDTAGGAMMDLGAHPMYTLAWFLGMPREVQSLFTFVTDKPVEDNAVSLLKFKKGAIGVSETGFVSVYNPYTLEISGTKGCLLVRDGLFKATAETDGKWEQVTALPAARPQPLFQWAQAVRGMGEVSADFGLEPAVRLTRIMQAAYKADKGEKVAEV